MGKVVFPVIEVKDKDFANDIITVKCEKTKKSVDELKVSEVIPLLMTTNPL
jgi:hypothetical protein